MTVDLDAAWRVLEVQPATPGNIRTRGTGRSTAVGEILVAVDEDGARAVLFPTSGDDAFAPDESTKVHLSRRNLRWQGGEEIFVAVTCAIERLKPVFTTLAEDMLESASDSSRPGSVLRRVLDEWRDLLAAQSQTLLGRNKLVGLIAELLTLREVLLHDPHRDIAMWTGPDAAVHDVRRGNRALEVKGSLTREGLFAEIHGLHQLEPPQPGGELHLVLHRFDEALDGDLTAPDLIRDILALGVDRHAFIDRLGRAGYDMADEADYARRRFRSVERRVYAVDATFPRLVPASLVGGDVPPGVILVRYTIDLTGPAPEALRGDAADQLFKAFGRGT
jgi:Putative  PD-(D/E)XK family member, (DUF4420)